MTSSRLTKFVVAACSAVGIAVAVACSSSTPQGINCGDGSQDCGGSCTVVARDTANCGACGKACAAGEVCSQGSCASACGGGTTKCGSECVDTKSDGRNCGSCGKACAANEVCMAGACATSCAMGTTKCGMGCVNTQVDPTNCGMCGTTCTNGQVCTAGKCGLVCASPTSLCDPSKVDGGVPDGGPTSPYCANFQQDNLNCGACGVRCSALEKCVAGQCTVGKISSLLLFGSVPANYVTDVKNGLLSTNSFKVVDSFDGKAQVPTLNQLQPYDSILVMTDGGGWGTNAATVGDVLADYFDQGGQVVVAAFANASIAVTGKFGTVNNGYMLINPTGQTSPTETLALQIVDNTSPLVLGVSKLTATAAYRSSGSIANGGTAVARWGSGANLIVSGTIKGHKRCDLYMYPPSAAVNGSFWVGDGYTIMRNCLAYR